MQIADETAVATTKKKWHASYIRFHPSHNMSPSRRCSLFSTLQAVFGHGSAARHFPTCNSFFQRCTVCGEAWRRATNVHAASSSKAAGKVCLHLGTLGRQRPFHGDPWRSCSAVRRKTMYTSQLACGCRNVECAQAVAAKRGLCNCTLA